MVRVNQMFGLPVDSLAFRGAVVLELSKQRHTGDDRLNQQISAHLLGMRGPSDGIKSYNL